MFDALREAIRELQRFDLDAVSDAELSEAVVELHRVEAMLDAATTKIIGAWDDRQAWKTDGARHAARWLTWKCKVAPAAARQRVRLARAVPHLPVVEEAWTDGAISRSHVAAFERVRNACTEAALARDEELLVGYARTFRFDHFHRAMQYWTQHADPDGVEHDAVAQHDRRKVHLSQTYDGMWFGDVVLDPIGGTAVATALKRIESEFFETDWAEARARLGDAATALDLARTPGQRRADALIEMANRAMTAPRDGRRPAPLLTVLVGYETFAGRICELANGTVVTPGSLLPLLDEAHLERVVFDGPSRVIDVGVERRLFTGATRRAIEVRDRECYHPACDLTADDAQIDHIEPWAYGGLTVQDNGRLACGFHNRARHRRT